MTAALARRVEELEMEVEVLRYTLDEATTPPTDHAGPAVDYGLTRSQAAILALLIKANGKPVRHDAIAAAVAWALQRHDDPTRSTTIKTQINRLRKRLAKVGAPFRVRTVSGFGYALEMLP